MEKINLLVLLKFRRSVHQLIKLKKTGVMFKTMAWDIPVRVEDVKGSKQHRIKMTEKAK